MAGMIAAYAYTAPVGSAENGKGSPLRLPRFWTAAGDKTPDVVGPPGAGPYRLNASLRSWTAANRGEVTGGENIRM